MATDNAAEPPPAASEPGGAESESWHFVGDVPVEITDEAPHPAATIARVSPMDDRNAARPANDRIARQHAGPSTRIMESNFLRTELIQAVRAAMARRHGVNTRHPHGAAQHCAAFAGLDI